MCLVFTCDQEDRVLATQMAPGNCPYCGGLVSCADVESEWRFCFLPFYSKTRRKYYCTFCRRKLVLHPST
ncbi:uncharacterized protein LOC116251179 [Nymphaea colorata]|uniref:Uncharacterized protein n=1 Tax=Nymphaea colorata TaxID=210225 RepID=A0A5K1BKX1_9MAGN|nr:uncharacterized protein LOC116251179 [Nymphaea colorata]